ncbi:MAG: beta-ketoacyl-ACP synthase 3 [Thermoguttaceae bacterium]
MFKMPLYLPAQGATEVEATIIEWHVAEGDRFQKGQALVQVDSAKSVFDFESPCDGLLIRRFHLEGETLPLTDAIMEIETSDPAMRDWIPPAATGEFPAPRVETASRAADRGPKLQPTVLLGFGGYVPARVVDNAELVADFPEITAEYVYQVTGIKHRHWADADEKPSDMAYQAALEAIRDSGIAAKEIDAVIVATTTPDVAMPSTAAIVQDRLNLQTIPAFDLNAACSGWLYAVSAARGMIVSGVAHNVLTIGVDMQSRLLDHSDRSAYFLFGDGAGASIISSGVEGHRIHDVLLGADTRGLHLAHRDEPGYLIRNGQNGVDPWIRIDGHALFRFAAESFTEIIRESMDRNGWTEEDVRWIVPHQANGRILKAAARRSRLGFDRFLMNVERVGNTSSASIPLALVEAGDKIHPGDKLILCSVGAGMTTAAIAVEW